MAQLFNNNANSKLVAGISNVSLSLQIAAGDGLKFPSPTGGDFFLVTLSKITSGIEASVEIVKVTARATDVFTIVRAQEGTTALVYAEGDTVSLRVTAGVINSTEAHKNSVSNPHSVTKSQVGLSNVDNTADTSKPVSTAQAAAIAASLAGGASSVGYLPSGAGAVTTTVQSKLRESVSVKDFGAVGDGVADDTAAFSLAAKNAPAANNIVGAEGLLPRAPMCLVQVPAGNYVITSLVNTGGRDVTWQLDHAAVITGFAYLNGTVMRLGVRQNDSQHGTTDYACNLSLRSNLSLDDGAEVLGIQTAAQLSTYADRDTVGLYVDNVAPAATYDTATASFTATTATVPAPPTSVLLKYRAGMVIDTKHSPKWSGIVSSWNADGSVITVTGWYQVGGTIGTPPSGTGLVLNGFTKVWAQNSNVFLLPSSHATSACGYELGLLNSKGDSSPNFSVAANRCWGFDSVNLGVNAGQAAFVARGAWHHGYYSRGPDTGFTFEGSAANKAFSAIGSSGAEFYSVDGIGNTSLGCASVAGSPFVDFQSSGVTSDYDSRIRASGGSSTTGQGTIEIIAASTVFYGALRPATNNVQNIGTPSFRPSFVYSTNLDVTSSLSIGTTASSNTPFIDFNASGNNIDYDVRLLASGGTGVSGNGTLTITAGAGTNFAGVIRSNQDNVHTCGIPAFRWSTVYAGTGTINTSDAREKQQIRTLTEAENAVAVRLKSLIRAFKFNDAVDRKGDAARIHFGVMAQDVKAAFEAEGLVAEAYAVLCYDEWDASPELLDDEGDVVAPGIPAGNRYGVRYEELMAFIISAL